jgi:hypothetical protein
MNLAALRVLLVMSPLMCVHAGLAEETSGIRPLLSEEHGGWPAVLPPGTRLLDDPGTIARFLSTLDQEPPDWPSVYGAGGHGHDERLFALNRERDGLREGQTVLKEVITFIWPGELSEYDPGTKGWRVAIGPKVISTRWGLVRFKPDGLPANLIAVPPPPLRATLRQIVSGGRRVEIEVAMTGRLIPEESIIYDFAHEEPGRGMVMPVIRIERVDYRLKR